MNTSRRQVKAGPMGQPLCFLLLGSLLATPALGTAKEQVVQTTASQPEKQPRVYRLESVELSGTSRMTTEQLAGELQLVKDMPLDDNLVMSTRSRLLSLGLFKSVILLMRKGSQPGLARLIIEVEDDDSVLTDWAIGGQLTVTGSENTISSVNTNEAALDYRMNLIGRNLFSSLHRGSLLIDIDSKGHLREGQLAYGLPRFTLEEAQFDAEIAAIDVGQRYLNALGFGGRGQGLWSRGLNKFGEVQYGAAMYINKKPDFAVPGFPAVVAGPKIAYYKETRLRSFFPGAGHLIGTSLLLAPTKTDRSVFELDLARTFAIKKLGYITLEGKALTIGVKGHSVRGEGRFDIPLGWSAPGEDQASLFLRLRGGHDQYESTNLTGSAAIIGMRYHSSGFIAELAFKITKSPDELTATTPLSFDRFREVP